MAFKIDAEALKAQASARVDLSGINFGLLDMLELWAEREWEKKQKDMPSEWDQGHWFIKAGEVKTGTACGTACCIAGKALSTTPGVLWANDERRPWTVADMGTNDEPAYALLPDSIEIDEDTYTVQVDINGRAYNSVEFDEAGRAILGLNYDEGNALFDGINDLNQIKNVLTKIRNGDYRRSGVEVPFTRVSECGVYATDYAKGLAPYANIDYLSGRCRLAKDHVGDHLFS